MYCELKCLYVLLQMRQCYAPDILRCMLKLPNGYDISLLLTPIGFIVCLGAEVAEFYSEQLSRQGISNMIEPDTTVL